MKATEPDFLVSLGDLGESKDCTESKQLYAGTTECFKLVRDYFDGFEVPFNIVGGNHDLEGIDEFNTDKENLEVFLDIMGKETPQFCHEVAPKTLLVGLGSTVFRDATYTSHEVFVDAEQVAWFENLVATHPAEEDWKIFCFSHAPPIGSGLRVLQENHVVNGCCWLNHNGGPGAAPQRFIETIRKNSQVKAWFSGHFHLGQDYQDSITFPTIPRELGPYPNRGSCVFAQTSVMRSGTSRDKRQQSRLLRGNKDGFEICTVNHADGGSVRLDATITYTDSNHEVGVYAHEHAELKENTNFIKVYSPSEGDECYVSYDDEGDGVSLDPLGSDCTVDGETIAWWHMSSGAVLGVYEGRLIEYEPSTLAPLGLVVGQDELKGKRVVVVGSGIPEECKVNTAPVSLAEGMEGADCAEAEGEEQAVLLVDDTTGAITVVQPNEDGSYWRKIVRNKMIRMREKRRVQAAKAYAQEELVKDGEEFVGKVVSSWGPYTSIVGTAVKTGVAGLTSASEFKAMSEWQKLAPESKEDVRASVGDELVAAFNAIDKNGSGEISVEELGEAVRMVSPTATDDAISDMFKAADADGNGKVSLNEFVVMMLLKQTKTPTPA